MNVASTRPAEKTGFVRLMEEHSLQPLWERFHALATPEPQPVVVEPEKPPPSP